MSLSILFAVHHVISRLRAVVEQRQLRRAEAGQSTAEYALVLLGAAAVALAFLLWATRTERIGNLFNDVLDSVIGKVA